MPKRRSNLIRSCLTQVPGIKQSATHHNKPQPFDRSIAENSLVCPVLSTLQDLQHALQALPSESTRVLQTMTPKTEATGISQTKIAKTALKSLQRRKAEGTLSRALSDFSSPQEAAAPASPSSDLIQIGTAQTGYPWQTVGKIQVGWNSDFTAVQYEGSGVLVSQNLILTAGHVIPWGKSGWWMRFAAGYRSGETPFGWIYISKCIGYDDVSTPAVNDFAVCQLYSNLGDVCGWMGTHWWADDNVYLSGIWSCQGYPTQLPIAATNIPIQKVTDGNGEDKLLFTVEFATGSAWDGGPLWDGGLSGTVNPLVIAVLSGQNFPYSVFAGGEDMVNLVIYGIENWT